MTDLHLISHHLCPYVQRSVIVLSEKNIPHRRTYIDLAAKPNWFREVSPLGRVPILQTGDTVVFESQVIVEFLDELTPGSLHPSNPLQRARHRSWIEFGSETLNAIAGFYNAPNASALDDKRKALRQKFARIEQEIVGPFFAGEAFHLIDGVWGTIFRYFDVLDRISDFGIMTNLNAVRTWRTVLATRRSIIGASPVDYAGRLGIFLKNRDSYLSTLIASDAVFFGHSLQSVRRTPGLSATTSDDMSETSTFQA